jgi:Zn-dependent protease with chaperone function
VATLQLLVLAASAAAVVGLANTLALRPWRQSAGAHWTERARWLWPARVGAVWNVMLGGLLAAVLAEWVGRGEAPVWYARLLAGWAGALAGSYRFDHEVFPAFTVPAWLRHLLAGWGMHLVLGGVLVTAMVWMPSKWNLTTLAISGAALGTQLALRLKPGVLALRALRILQPADPPLLELVQAASETLRIPVAGVWVLGGPQAQAYALPVTGELWFSRRLLAICTEEELRAVAAHELAHLAESRLTVAGRVAASLVWWPLVFVSPALESFGLLGLLGLFAVCLGLNRASRGLSQHLERRADRVATNAQAHAGVYAAALEKLYRENQLPAVNPKGVSTHPSLYDRLTAAGRVPDYPRPQPPQRVAWTTILLLVLWLAAFVGATLERAGAEREPWGPPDWGGEHPVGSAVVDGDGPVAACSRREHSFLIAAPECRSPGFRPGVGGLRWAEVLWGSPGRSPCLGGP